MSGLAPLETLYDDAGDLIPLPPALAAQYGAFRVAHIRHPYIIGIGNVVTTLDGVVALNTPCARAEGGPTPTSDGAVVFASQGGVAR